MAYNCWSRIDLDACTLDGTLTISSHSMHRSAFAVVDVSSLWEGAVPRGQDLLIPGRPGQLARRRHADVTEHQLPTVIDGRFDVNGNRNSNERQGLLENILWLRTNVTDVYSVGYGTRSITLTSPDGSLVATGQAHISLEVGEKIGSLWKAMIDVSLPDGALAWAATP